MAISFYSNPFDLLGQTETVQASVHLPGAVEPRLSIAWDSFHQNFFTGLPVLFQRVPTARALSPLKIFREQRMLRGVERWTFLVAAVFHVILFQLPWSLFSSAPRRNTAFDDIQLTWSGPIQDLPLLNVPREKHRSSPKSGAQKPTSTISTPEPEALHPRQRIHTDPVRPTHPRQTLINSAAPPEAPKFLPDMANIVQIASIQAPARPRISIDQQSLARLRPRKAKAIATRDAPAPEVVNQEQHTAELNLAAATTGPTKPKLVVNAGVAPRLASKTQNGQPTPAPEDLGISAAPTGSSATFIALSSTPGPAAPVVPPQGNLAARVAMSPEGRPGGTGAGASTTSNSSSTPGSPGTNNNSIGITISGGSPKPNVTTSGAGGPGKLNLSHSASSMKRPDAKAEVEDEPVRTSPPNFAALPPGAKPEQIFASRHIYTMNVNMPNLNSATGSWVIRFSELHLIPGASRASDVSAPVPLRKVDPKYPQTLVEDHVEGEVTLYGVIRPDGSVDSIQLVRGVDDQLDANAVQAFSQWKFEPATKEGQPVALEAIVHIPFHAPERR
jgi:TonB family protein